MGRGLLLGLLFLAATRPAFAETGDFYLGSPVECRPGRRWVVASRLGFPGSGHCAKLTRRYRARPKAFYLFSWRNDNSLYRFYVRAQTERRWLYLRAGEETYLASAGAPPYSDWEFEVTRADADALAARYGIPRHDRRPLAEGITWEFTGPVAPVAAGQPIEIGLSVRTVSPTPVFLSVGGDSLIQCETWRAPRSSRRRAGWPRSEGERIQTQHAFVNVAGYRELSPEKPFVFQEDLRTRCGLTEPGSYEVRLSFPIELWTRPRPDRWHQHERWQERATGRVTMTVR
jgi:hypothetical protein